MILDHIETARTRNLPNVYLGYWVQGSDKMDYKARFAPLEALGANGWEQLKP
jgi:arginine-tRNA-protein transferase